MPRIRRWLPLSAIRIDRYPFSRVIPIVDFLRNGGETKPIKVVKVPQVVNSYTGEVHSSGYYRIKDGRHRFLAHRLLGRTHIEVIYGQRGGNTAP